MISIVSGYKFLVSLNQVNNMFKKYILANNLSCYCIRVSLCNHTLFNPFIILIANFKQLSIQLVLKDPYIKLKINVF